MAFIPLKNLFVQVAQVTPEQFDEWSRAWRVAAENGSQESLSGFICRERGISEDLFLQQMAGILGWPYLDLPHTTIAPEIRQKISTKVAFQYSVLPPKSENGILQVVVSNPFGPAMASAVQ